MEDPRSRLASWEGGPGTGDAGNAMSATPRAGQEAGSPPTASEQESDMLGTAGNLHLQRKAAKTTSRMKPGAEKDISSETDNLMENRASVQVNNTTRERLCRILI